MNLELCSLKSSLICLLADSYMYIWFICIDLFCIQKVIQPFKYLNKVWEMNKKMNTRCQLGKYHSEISSDGSSQHNMADLSSWRRQCVAVGVPYSVGGNCLLYLQLHELNGQCTVNITTNPLQGHTKHQLGTFITSVMYCDIYMYWLYTAIITVTV
jgi:hypothetical protein